MTHGKYAEQFIFDPNGSNLVVLQGFGHCGIDWLHSFFKFVPGILTMPAFSYYRAIHENKLDRHFYENNLEELIQFFVTHMSSALQFESSSEQNLGLNSNGLNDFWNDVRSFFSLGHSLNRKNFFLALNNAYFKNCSFNQEQPRIIVYQEHICFHAEQILQDFPQAKILMILRDPRASLAGYIRGLKRKFPNDPTKFNFYYNFCFEEWIFSHSLYKKMKQLPNFKVVKNESLKSDLEQEMKKICEWIDFPFTPSLLKENNPDGSTWKIDSCYISRDEKNPDLTTYYSAEKIKSRWMEILDTKEKIKIIEVLFSDIFIEFSYPFDILKNDITKSELIFEKINSLIYFLTLNPCREYGIEEKNIFSFHWLSDNSKSMMRRLNLFFRQMTIQTDQ